MANELTTSVVLEYEKGAASFAVTEEVTVTVTGTLYCDLSQSIATSSTAVDFGTVGTPGWVFIQNIGTNYVEIGFDTTTWPIKLSAGTATAGGGICLFYNNGGTVYGRANTAANQIAIRAVAP